MIIAFAGAAIGVGALARQFPRTAEPGGVNRTQVATAAWAATTMLGVGACLGGATGTSAGLLAGAFTGFVGAALLG